MLAALVVCLNSLEGYLWRNYRKVGLLTFATAVPAEQGAYGLSLRIHSFGIEV